MLCCADERGGQHIGGGWERRRQKRREQYVTSSREHAGLKNIDNNESKELRIKLCACRSLTWRDDNHQEIYKTKNR